MKKNTIRVDDIWNEKVPLKNIHVVEDTIIDIDDKLKKCEEALERAELGIGYDESLLKKFGDAIEDRNTVYNFTWQLTTWIHDNIDAPFKNDFDTYAWSPLSDIDYRKYEIDNDIGVTTKNSHPNAQGIIIEKKKLNLKDFLGSENEDKKSDSKTCEQVDDFAKIFKEQYKNLSKTMSEGDEKVKLPDMRKFWDPESKTADERFKEFLSMVADATIIVPIADAILGKDIITGEKLSAYGVTSKILIAVIDVITLGIGSLSNPAVSGVIKEYALGLGAATVSAAVYEVADASGLPPAVINALTIGAGIVTVIIGNKVLFKNKAGKVLATKDIDELKNPRVRGNETPPLRNEIDDYLDDVGDFYENDVFGHYYDEWPELDDYFDELARYSEDIDVGSVSKTSYGKSSEIIQCNTKDAAADELAKRIGGQSRSAFADDPIQREFDVISDIRALPEYKQRNKRDQDVLINDISELVKDINAKCSIVQKTLVCPKCGSHYRSRDLKYLVCNCGFICDLSENKLKFFHSQKDSSYSNITSKGWGMDIIE